MKLFCTNYISIVDKCRHFFNFRVNYCVSALLSFCTNCTHTVVNLIVLLYCSLVNLFLLYMILLPFVVN